MRDHDISHQPCTLPHHRGRHRGDPFDREFPDHRIPRGGPHSGRRGEGRRARRGDIRLAILQVITEEPANGYSLMTTIAERTDDRWRPSPGSVYPILQLLVDEGFAIKDNDDQGRYAITDAGRDELDRNRDQADSVWDNGRIESESGEQLRASLHKLMGATREISMSGTDDQRERTASLVDNLRRELYRILSE